MTLSEAQGKWYGVHRLENFVWLSGILISAALLLASGFSRFWLPLDTISQFTLHIILLGSSCCAALVMPRARFLTAVIVVITGLLSIGAHSHFVMAHADTRSSIRAGEAPLRIVTFNTSVINADTGAVSQELRRLDADVAVLMEFSEAKYSVIEHNRGKYPYI